MRVGRGGKELLRLGLSRLCNAGMHGSSVRCRRTSLSCQMRSRTAKDACKFPGPSADRAPMLRPLPLHTRPFDLFVHPSASRGFRSDNVVSTETGCSAQPLQDRDTMQTCTTVSQVLIRPKRSRAPAPRADQEMASWLGYCRSSRRRRRRSRAASRSHGRTARDR